MKDLLRRGQISADQVRRCIADALIDTVLEVLDLLVDRANRRLIPNPAHPDRPVVKIR